MNSYFFAVMCIVASLAAMPLGQGDAAQPAGAKAAEREPRYAAYWLTRADGKSEYRMLLITRTPLGELAKLLKLHGELENVLKGVPAPQLLDWPALTIATYKKDSIWNDGVPLKPLTRFEVNEKERTALVNGVRHKYEECPLADVVRLLDSPEGKERIHRLFPPLGGMEQTARALRLLVAEQMKEDEANKEVAPAEPPCGS